MFLQHMLVPSLYGRSTNDSIYTNKNLTCHLNMYYSMLCVCVGVCIYTHTLAERDACVIEQ